MVKIRIGTLKDIPQIIGLWKDFMEEHDRDIEKRNKLLKEQVVKSKTGASKFRTHLIDLLKTKKGRLIVAEENGTLVGYNLAQIKKEIPVFKLRRFGLIADLYIKKEFRGQGIATIFKNKAVEWFKRNKLKYMSITVYPDNRHAYKIYKKWGFTDYKINMRKKI
jgi:ribosomal protein S18 acetylase RimI-like enzyme